MKYNFGYIYTDFEGIQLSCRAMVPGYSLQDLCKIYKTKYDELDTPENNFSSNLSKNPTFQTMATIVETILDALNKEGYLKNV